MNYFEKYFVAESLERAERLVKCRPAVRFVDDSEN